MRAAIEAAAAYDGTSTVVLAPDKTYRTTEQIDIDGSGIRFAGGGTWQAEASGSTLYLNRSHQDDTHPAHPIAPATAGATFVTTVDPPTGLAVGDWVLVYTGHTTTAATPPGYPLGAPDSELNRVASIAGNVVGLVLPLVKDYAQEYWAPGESYATGTTSTTNTGDPAPLAVRKVEPLVGIAFDGITIDQQADASFVNGNSVAGLTFTDCTITTAHSVMAISTWTGEVTRCVCHSTLAGAVPWMFTVAYGARDVTVTDCTFTADGIGYFHIHEGASNVAFQNVTIVNGAGVDVGAHYVIGCRGRGYNITFDNVTVTNISIAPGSAALRVDDDVTGSATGCTFDGGVVNESDDFTVT